MVALTELDRRALTAGVLRVAKASQVFVDAMVRERWPISAPGSQEASWLGATAWDGNETPNSVRFLLQRAALAAAEQMRGLADLCRSSREYTVALATLTRASIEALARLDWVVSATTADSLVSRVASLESADLRYPIQHGLQIWQRGMTKEEWIPVSNFRKRIEEFVNAHGLLLSKASLTELATDLLDKIYNEAPQLYSGMSAAAHGQSWATGNFYDTERGGLARDDQMVIEYCAYAIECATHAIDDVSQAFSVPKASVERWISERDKVNLMLSVILGRRDQPS